jgi:hypothetical protein
LFLRVGDQGFGHLDGGIIERFPGDVGVRAVRVEQRLFDHEVDGGDHFGGVLCVIQFFEDGFQPRTQEPFGLVSAQFAQPRAQLISGVGTFPDMQAEFVLSVPFRHAR